MVSGAQLTMWKTNNSGEKFFFKQARVFVTGCLFLLFRVVSVNYVFPLLFRCAFAIPYVFH